MRGIAFGNADVRPSKRYNRFHLVAAVKELIRESWQRTLSGIETIAGRLAYLASLRDPNTGHYQHFGLAQKVGEAESDRILRQSHLETFQQWLCFNVAQQREDALTYLESLDGNTREIIANWLRIRPYQGWVPAESRDAERQLFLTDLGIVSELIRTEFGVASPDPDL